MMYKGTLYIFLMQGLPDRRGMLWKAGQFALGPEKILPYRANNPTERVKKPL